MFMHTHRIGKRQQLSSNPNLVNTEGQKTRETSKSQSTLVVPFKKKASEHFGERTNKYSISATKPFYFEGKLRIQ